MINKSERLVTLLDNSGTYEDLSTKSASFIRDSFNVELLDNDDYLYIGYYKPTSCFYSELVAGTSTATSVVFESFDGAAWVPLVTTDETNGFTRSGFISFDPESLQSTTIDGKENFYIRAQYTGLVEFKGIGCVFSDDESLSQEYFEIINECLYAAGFDSHITSHLSARNHILQLLKNEGYMTFDSNCDPTELTCFDLLDLSQVRLSSTYLTLSNIFYRMSDSDESIYWDKYKEYQMKFKETFKSLRLTLDKNQNGINDSADETVAVDSDFTWSR